MVAKVNWLSVNKGEDEDKRIGIILVSVFEQEGKQSVNVYMEKENGVGEVCFLKTNSP